MATLRFLSQSTLDSWLEESRADLRSGALVDLQSSAELPVREAVHFVKLESGDDTERLLNKVKTLEQLKLLGAEHCMTSVILGETVYEVVAGWVAEERTDVPTVSAPMPATASPAAKKYEGKNSEADMLAQLLLDKLS